MSSLGQNLLPQDGNLYYIPHFFSPEEAQELNREMMISLKWRQDKIKMFGKEHPLPRLQAWYGDPGKSYTYSGLRLEPEPWHEPLTSIKLKLGDFCGVSFNSLLANLYRSGADHVSWHADDEKELGPEPYIASLSFGGIRRFQLKHRSVDLSPLSLDLGPGSLLIMSGKLQHSWLHRLVPAKKSQNIRINLTFRKIL